MKRLIGFVGLVCVALAASAHAVPNPALASDCPDPYILRVGSTYHLYCTGTTVAGSGLTHIPHYKSTDLETWTFKGDALPTPGSWASTSAYFTWAPTLLNQGSYYVLFYTAQVAGSSQMCIGRAISVSPNGPFVDTWTTPLQCDNSGSGNWALDPSVFTDTSGGWTLIWRQDGDGANHIYVDALDSTGENFSTITYPADLIDTSEYWENGLIEGPSMANVDGEYFLFYSAGAWGTASYAIGYATCTSAYGPCTKATTNGPWVASSAPRLGPGGEDFFTDPTGALWIAMHGWDSPTVGYPAGARMLWVYQMQLINGAPAL